MAIGVGKAGWSCFLLLVCVCHCQLYVSTTGSTSSTECTVSQPCASLKQALDVFDGAPASSLHVYLAPGDYQGSLNSGLSLPAVPTVIERWSGQEGTVSFTVTSDFQFQFGVSADLTLANVSLSTTNSSSSLLSISASWTDSLLDLSNCVIHGALLSYASGNQLVHLSMDSCYYDGNLEIQGANVSLTRSTFGDAIIVSTSTRTIITECSFLDTPDLTFAGDFISIAGSRFNASDFDPTMIGLVGSTVMFEHTQLVNYVISLTECAQVVLDHVDIDSARALSSSCSQVLITDSVIVSSQCLNLQAQKLGIYTSEFHDCSTMAAKNLYEAVLQGSYFDSTGTLSMTMRAGYTGHVQHCTFEDFVPSGLSLEGDWIVDTVFMSRSEATSSSSSQTMISFGSGTLHVMNSDFSGNPDVTYTGSAIRTSYYSSSLYVQNSQFRDLRFGQYGGAVYSSGSVAEFENCEFTNMYARYDGGALALLTQTARIASCTFNNTESGGNGGAVLVQGASNITGCSFSNSASDNGVVYYQAYRTTSLENSEFSNCTSGGIVLVHTNSDFDLSRVVFNHCSSRPIECEGGAVITLNDPYAVIINGVTGTSGTKDCRVSYHSGPDNRPLVDLFILICGCIFVVAMVGWFLRELKSLDREISAA